VRFRPSVPAYHSTEGHGTPPSIEDYPFQGLAVEVEPYDFEWLWWARWDASTARKGEFGENGLPAVSAGDYKHDARTPLGTPVAQLAREGHDLFQAPCGHCQQNIQKCRCAFEAPSARHSGPVIRGRGHLGYGS
jgi:hypothetical protein